MDVDVAAWRAGNGASAGVAATRVGACAAGAGAARRPAPARAPRTLGHRAAKLVQEGLRAPDRCQVGLGPRLARARLTALTGAAAAAAAGAACTPREQGAMPSDASGRSKQHCSEAVGSLEVVGLLKLVSSERRAAGGGGEGQAVLSRAAIAFRMPPSRFAPFRCRASRCLAEAGTRTSANSGKSKPQWPRAMGTRSHAPNTGQRAARRDSVAVMNTAGRDRLQASLAAAAAACSALQPHALAGTPRGPWRPVQRVTTTAWHSAQLCARGVRAAGARAHSHGLSVDAGGRPPPCPSACSRHSGSAGSGKWER